MLRQRIDHDTVLNQTKKVANWSVAKHQGGERTQAGGEKTTATIKKKKQFKRRQILKTVKVLTGLYSWGQDGSRVLGKIFVNHVIASSRWSPPSALVTLRSSLGTFVGNKAHRLCPDTRLFHALVPKGSMWIPVPERAGPITNHLQKYRSDKNKTLLVSKCVSRAN